MTHKDVLLQIRSVIASVREKIPPNDSPNTAISI